MTRSELIAEVAEYLAGKVLANLDRNSLAESLVEEGRINGDAISFEVPARYTILNDPIACEFDAPTD